MKKLLMLTLVLATAPAFAANYSCKKDAAEREISIVYAKEGAKLPCEVKYKKEGSNDLATKWSATNKEGYCEEKAKEFSERLAGLGFKCEEKK